MNISPNITPLIHTNGGLYYLSQQPTFFLPRPLNPQSPSRLVQHQQFQLAQIQHASPQQLQSPSQQLPQQIQLPPPPPQHQQQQQQHHLQIEPIRVPPPPLTKDQTNAKVRNIKEKCISHYIDGQLIIETPKPLSEKKSKSSKKKNKSLTQNRAVQQQQSTPTTTSQQQQQQNRQRQSQQLQRQQPQSQQQQQIQLNQQQHNNNQLQPTPRTTNQGHQMQALQTTTPQHIQSMQQPLNHQPIGLPQNNHQQHHNHNNHHHLQQPVTPTTTNTSAATTPVTVAPISAASTPAASRPFTPQRTPPVQQQTSKTDISRIRAEMPTWSVAKVVEFIERHEDIRQYSSKFAEDEIDGTALLLMIDRNLNFQMLSTMFKHGPAMKVEATLSKYKINE